MTLIIGTLIALFEIVIIVWQVITLMQVVNENKRFKKEVKDEVGFIRDHYVSQVKEVVEQNREILLVLKNKVSEI